MPYAKSNKSIQGAAFKKKKKTKKQVLKKTKKK